MCVYAVCFEGGLSAQVNVPPYWEGYERQSRQHFVAHSFAEGLWNALTYQLETHELELWRSSLLWKTASCHPFT